MLSGGIDMPQHQSNDKHRVLVVDDDLSIRQLVQTIVRRVGLEADTAADGQQAIELLTENHYAIVLLDLMMPRLNGFEVIDYLREHPPVQKPVVLVITAYADQQFKEVDPNIVAGVIRKPFEVADLGEIVRLCVSGYDDEARRRLSQLGYAGMRSLMMVPWKHGDSGESAN
jgi:CheY-like chemotaxis protein